MKPWLSLCSALVLFVIPAWSAQGTTWSLVDDFYTGTPPAQRGQWSYGWLPDKTLPGGSRVPDESVALFLYRYVEGTLWYYDNYSPGGKTPEIWKNTTTGRVTGVTLVKSPSIRATAGSGAW